MMNTNDAVNEILKRKTAIIQEKRSRIKKLTVVMTLIVLCIGIGTASWMIGTNKTDAPNKPPKVTYGIATNENTESKETPSGSETEGGSESDTTESEPQTTESEPQSTESEPQTTESEPQTTESEPQPTESEPQPTESEPQTTESEPQTTESKPQTTESEQKSTEPKPTEPQITPDTPIEDEPIVVPNEDTGKADKTPVLECPRTPTEEDEETESSLPKYRDFFYVREYDYYFEDESVFYDGTYPLSIKSYEYSYDKNALNEGWKEWFREYVMKLYGDEYDPEKIASNYYETDDKYVKQIELPYWAEIEAPRRIEYNKASNLICIDLDIGAVDGYFDLNPTEALEYVKNLKYFTAAVAHLGITDPYIEMWESYLDCSHSYWFFVYDKSDYFNLSERTSEKGYFYVFLSFGDYEGDEHDRVSADINIYKPRNISVTNQTDTVTYDTVLSYILGRFDYGDEFEYVKNNIKCIPHYTANRQRDVLLTVYSFYVEYYDENGNKYYEYLGDCSMVDYSKEE